MFTVHKRQFCEQFGFFESLVSSSSKGQFARGGWLSNHIWSFTQPTSRKLLRNREPRYDNDNRQVNLVLCHRQHTNRTSVLSDFECRHRDATMTSQLELNCRILPEYEVITRFSWPTVTRQWKEPELWLFILQRILFTSSKPDNNRKISRPILESKRKILTSNPLKHSKISSHIFYRYDVNSWTSPYPFCFCYDGSQSFSALWDLKTIEISR